MAKTARPEAEVPSGSDLAPGGTAVPIYGGSSIAIHEQIVFSHSSLEIGPEGERTLAALTELLSAFDCRIEILGHASEDEQRAAAWLSKRRAEVVRDRLLALGVDAHRLSVSARGASPSPGNQPRRAQR